MTMQRGTTGTEDAVAKEKDMRKDRVPREFRLRQTRQIIAIAAALFLVLLVAAVHKRPDLFGSYHRSALFAVQALIIASFIGFSAANWRCPACRSFLGSDIHRTRCRKCGTRLQ
jgi:hypothetical protein